MKIMKNTLLLVFGAACTLGCEDSSTFTFGTYMYNNVDIARDCAWLTTNSSNAAIRISEWCPQMYEDVAISDECEQTCNGCPAPRNLRSLSRHLSPGIPTNSRELCGRKYILLSTQRSGSTWTCSLFQQQDNVSCGGRMTNIGPASELLIEYSYMKSNGRSKVEWSTYKKSLDDAFAEACRENPAETIGFKLMYDQIPTQFLEGDNLLQSYLQEHKVSIVHLVREAKILRLASQFNSRHQINEFKTMHSANASDAKKFRETPKMPWNEGLIDEMLELEKISSKWQKTIHFMPLVQDYYLSYESLLLETERRLYLKQVMSVLTNRNVEEIDTRGSLMQLHEPLCSDRIENYKEFREHEKVRGSRSAAACDLIQYIFGDKGEKTNEEDDETKH